jgi:hypothetical protein
MCRGIPALEILFFQAVLDRGYRWSDAVSLLCHFLCSYVVAGDRAAAVPDICLLVVCGGSEVLASYAVLVRTTLDMFASESFVCTAQSHHVRARALPACVLQCGEATRSNTAVTGQPL